MTDASTSAAIVTEDMFCRRCGYNLRALPVAGLCPECGTDVAQSLVGNWLRHADPEWLDKLRLGASLKLWNILLGFVFSIVASVLMLAGLPPAAIVFVTAIAGALGLWATFLITTQEPRIALQEDTVTLRTALRLLAIAGFVGAVLQHAGNAGAMRFPTTGGLTISIALPLVGALLSLAGVFVLWGELVYLRRFAVRIPDPKLAKSTTMLMWILPITAALGIGLGLVVILGVVTSAGTPAGPPTPPAAAIGASTLGICAVSVFALYLYIWYIRLLVRYRKGFATAAAESRAVPATPVARPLQNTL